MSNGGPVWSDDPTPRKRRLRLLVLGPPKIGKSTCVVGTAPQPVYVINCDQDNALDHVTSIYPKARFAQEKFPVHDMASMDRGLYVAKKMAREGEIRTVVLDTLSGFSRFLIKECEELNSDGRKYFPAYTNYIVNVCSRICELPCHVVVTSHHIQTSDDDNAEAMKTGPGIVPLLETKGARARVGGEFSDVVFMENRKGKGRMFVSDIEGIWGPGCRNIHGKKVDTAYKANIKTLMRAMGMLTPKVLKKRGFEEVDATGTSEVEE